MKEKLDLDSTYGLEFLGSNVLTAGLIFVFRLISSISIELVYTCTLLNASPLHLHSYCEILNIMKIKLLFKLKV